MTGEKRIRNFCTRVQVTVLTPSHGFMLFGERGSEKPLFGGLQEKCGGRSSFSKDKEVI